MSIDQNQLTILRREKYSRTFYRFITINEGVIPTERVEKGVMIIDGREIHDNYRTYP